MTMRNWIAVGALLGASLIWTHPADAAQLMIRNAVVKVTIVPENRTDIVVKIIKSNPKLPLTVQQGLNGDVIVDGSERYGAWGFLLGGRTTNCHREGDEPVVHVFGVGDVRGADMPQIVVQVPMDAHVSTGGATFGSVGRSDALDLHIAGCDDWVIANVAGRMAISDAGVARVRTGTSGSLSLHISGSSDVKTGDVASGMELHIAGSGQVENASVNGPISMSIAGHGDISILGGRASDLKVHIAGSGKVRDQGTAENLDAQIAGSGEINVAQVTGTVTKHVAGVGTINIGHP
jgi:hypothetical protein